MIGLCSLTRNISIAGKLQILGTWEMVPTR